MPLGDAAACYLYRGYQGQKIRGYGIATDVIERLGGVAVPMAAGEVYQALERGVLDGVYGFDFVTAIAYKLHEIAPISTILEMARMVRRRR